MSDDLEEILESIREGDIQFLEFLAEHLPSFPSGIEDQILGTRWITYAIDAGSLESVLWMLRNGTKIDFEDGMGYTVLHSAIESKSSKKYEIMEKLLEFGADVNKRGFNDWTPTHLAAARNDVNALEILVRAGADLNARTRIDNFSTPLELAKLVGTSPDAVSFLETAESTMNL
ncbi:MAG: ankyrin repeat domain-containing protein [Verrucomicrobiales bacterium]|nr:ankyrin repeat domain-containing protein [Verrucomicrobiales bacterium]